jgi:hypothetical protein
MEKILLDRNLCTLNLLVRTGRGSCLNKVGRVSSLPIYTLIHRTQVSVYREQHIA